MIEDCQRLARDESLNATVSADERNFTRPSEDHRQDPRLDWNVSGVREVADQLVLAEDRGAASSAEGVTVGVEVDAGVKNGCSSVRHRTLPHVRRWVGRLD